MDTLNPSAEIGNPVISLGGLLDLLDVLEAEISLLPEPAPLFAHELAAALSETMGVSGDVC